VDGDGSIDERSIGDGSHDDHWTVVDGPGGDRVIVDDEAIADPEAVVDPAAVVDGLLGRLVACLRARDPDGAVGLFDEDAVLFASEVGERAVGRAELRTFFARTFRRPHTYGWVWERPLTGRGDGIVWFVAPATVVIRGDDGTERTAPYRLSAVLRRGVDGAWRFALFNGAEPAPPEAGASPDPADRGADGDAIGGGR